MGPFCATAVLTGLNLSIALCCFGFAASFADCRGHCSLRSDPAAGRAGGAWPGCPALGVNAPLRCRDSAMSLSGCLARLALSAACAVTCKTAFAVVMLLVCI